MRESIIIHYFSIAIINRFANKWILLDAIKSAKKTWINDIEFRRNSMSSSNRPRRKLLVKATTF